jgi:hypothetical protein
MAFKGKIILPGGAVHEVGAVKNQEEADAYKAALEAILPWARIAWNHIKLDGILDFEELPDTVSEHFRTVLEARQHDRGRLIAWGLSILGTTEEQFEGTLEMPTGYWLDAEVAGDV